MLTVSSLEPYSPTSWERYADAGINMTTFGHSLPGKYIYQHFEYTTEKMSEKIMGFLGSWTAGEVDRGEFVDLYHGPSHA